MLNHGQDCPWKALPENQVTENNGKRSSVMQPILGSRTVVTTRTCKNGVISVSG